MRLATLTDTGPLVALVVKNDPDHLLCLEATRHLPFGPLLTTWPCLTEAMYLVYRAGGYRSQEALWALRETGRLLLHDLTATEVDQMKALMRKYQNLPMDLADASLVAAAESFGVRRVFTLDGDFYVYRLADGTALDIFPHPSHG